jgi:hypothetical protein
VKRQNKLYFTSRSCLEGLAVLNHIEHEIDAPVDIPGKILNKMLEIKNSGGL